MAGTLRTGAYPTRDDPNFDPTWDLRFPVPSGYDNWSQYILDVLNAQARGERGPTAYVDVQLYGGAPGQMYQQEYMPGVTPGEMLLKLGYGDLASRVDTSNPQIRQFLDQSYYSGSSYDTFSPWGDQFSQALMGLGAFVGGSAALGAFAPAAEAAAGGALGAGELGLETTFPAAAGAVGTGAADAALPAAAGAVAPVSSLGMTGPSAVAGMAPEAVAGAGGLAGMLSQWAPVAMPAIGAGTSLLGGMLAGNAAKDAAQTQANAATDANQLLMRMYDQQRADLAPYLGAGYAALGQMAQLGDTPLTYSPYTATPTLNPAGYGFDPNAYAFTAPNQALSAEQYRYAPNTPLSAQQYAFTPPSGQEVLNQDPGYAFRLSEGLKALQASQAAKGGLVSGGALKALEGYGQGLASQEYGNAYARALGQNQLAYGRALQENQDVYGRGRDANVLAYQRALQENQDVYNRALTQNQMGYERGLQGNQLTYGRAYQQNAEEAARGLQAYQTNLGAQQGLRQQRFNELASLAGLGQTTGTQQAGLTGQLGSQLANNLTSAGAAQAGGQVAANNMLMQGLGGVGNAANSYLNYQMLTNLLQRR